MCVCACVCVYLGSEGRLQGFESSEQVDVLRRSLRLLAVRKNVEQSVQRLSARHQIQVFRSYAQQRVSDQLDKLTRKLIIKLYY